MSLREVSVVLVTGYCPNSGWIQARSICAWRIENQTDLRGGQLHLFYRHRPGQRKSSDTVFIHLNPKQTVRSPTLSTLLP